MKLVPERLALSIWRLPLRIKVAIWTGLLVGLLQVFIATGVVTHIYVEGLDELDKNLAKASHHFFREIASKREVIDWSNTAQVERMLSTDGEPYLAEISDRSGTVLHRSRLMERVDFSHLTTGGRAVTMRIHGKLLRVAVFEEAGLKVTIGIGAYLVYETREDVLRTFLVTSPIALIVVGLGGWWIAGRALAPVVEVTTAAEAITAERLDQRLPMPPANDEIGRLTVVLNRMIDRLEKSFLQASRFTADASHELRTPLTILRGEIENALRERDLTTSQEKLLLNLLEEVDGLSRITEGLLLLSRADAGRLQLVRTPVDLSRLVGELIEDIEILAQADDVRVECHIADGVSALGFEPFLRQVALNLLDNAIKYNRPSGHVRIDLGLEAGNAVLVIGNTGEGMTAQQVERLFERFYRGRAAQDDRRRGHGLGLSICREIARAHGGEIVLSRSDVDWVEFKVTLPAASRSVPAQTAS